MGVAVPVIAHGAALAHLLYCVHANAAPPVLYRSGQHAHLHRVDGFAHVAAAAQGNGFHDAVFQLQRRLLFLLQNGKSPPNRRLDIGRIHRFELKNSGTA